MLPKCSWLRTGQFDGTGTSVATKIHYTVIPVPMRYVRKKTNDLLKEFSKLDLLNLKKLYIILSSLTGSGSI